ncbi:MAG: glycosyltransferase family 2 protein [Gammaproteobacteria bacterium]
MQTSLGIVVIGRNEGSRLRRCLESLSRYRERLVYVDSASTDGSVAVAKSYGVAAVVELDIAIPLNAARARHEGFIKLRQLYPHLQFVFFVDGDCEVVSDWFDQAISAFKADSKLAVVCGRRRERYPEHSIFNRLCDIEWDTPIGEALSCGGDAVMRTDVYHSVGGFNPNVPAGEEPQLCHRIRQAGWKVCRIDAEMTLHDANITHWSQWWRRYVRSGHAAMHVQERFGIKYFAQINRSIRIWAVAWPATLIFFGIASWVQAGASTGLATIGIIVCAMPIQMVRVAYRAWRRGLNFKDALGYGILIMLAKMPELFGQLQYLTERSSGRAAPLIEYKN